MCVAQKPHLSSLNPTKFAGFGGIAAGFGPICRPGHRPHLNAGEFTSLARIMGQ